MKARDRLFRGSQWRQMAEEAGDKADACLEVFLREQPNGGEKRTAKLGKRVFTSCALRRKSIHEWAGLQKLRLAEAQLALNLRRVKLAEDLADAKLGPVVKPLSPEEKERRMKAIMGIA